MGDEVSIRGSGEKWKRDRCNETERLALYYVRDCGGLYRFENGVCFFDAFCFCIFLVWSSDAILMHVNGLIFS